MKNIFVGTTSEAKIKIVKNFFGREYNIIAKEVSSGIADQPLDENTTKKVRSIAPKTLQRIVAIIYFLWEWRVAYKDSNNNLTVGISNKLPLPKEVSDKVKQGQQFGRAIRDFKISTKTKSPDVIEQIEELITREKSFTSALQKAIANLPK